MSTIIEGIDLAVKVVEKLENCRKEQKADIVLNLEQENEDGGCNVKVTNIGLCKATDIFITALEHEGEGLYYWDASKNETLIIPYLAPSNGRVFSFCNNSFKEELITFEIEWTDDRKERQTETIMIKFTGLCN